MRTLEQIVALAFLLLLCAGCGRTARATLAPLPAPSPPEFELAFRRGQAAFREATPEGYQRAVEAFRKAVDLNPKSCEYALHLSQSLFFLAQQLKANWEEFADPVSEANAIVTFNRGTPGCLGRESMMTRLETLAIALRPGARLADAMASINRAIEFDPADPMNWVVLSQLRPAAGRDGTVPILRAAELAPELPVVQFELGNYWLTAQDTYPSARSAFERALALSPRHFQSIIGIVYSLTLSGEEDVEPLLRKAAELAPRSLKARILLGDYYAGLEETENAEEQYRAAIEVNPRYYPAHIALGTALMTAERPDDAEPAFNAVIALDVKIPKPPMNGVDLAADAGAHYFLGNIWMERGDLVRARAEYLASIADISNYAAAIYGLGTVLHREGKVDEALAQLDTVIQLGPEQFPNAYLARGGIRAERRQFADALKDLEQAVEIYRQQAAALEAKARVAHAKGWKRKAEGELKRKALIEGALDKALQARRVVQAQLGAQGVGRPESE